MKKRAFMIMILCMLPVMMGGCWGYKDVDQLYIAMGGYVDRDPITQDYILSVEIVTPQGGQEGKMTMQEVKGNGETILKAIRDAIIEAGGRLYWGHTQVWVVSRPVAEDGILNVLDMITRGTELRADTDVLIYDGDNSGDMIKMHEERDLQPSMAQHLMSMLEEYERAGVFIDRPVWEVNGELDSEGTALVIPLMETYERDNKPKLDVKGCALFSGDKMVGYIPKDEAKYLYLMKGKLKKEYLFSIPKTNEMPATAIEVSSTERTIKITPGDKGAQAYVEFKIKANLVSYQSEKDMLTVEGIKYLEEEYEGYITEEINALIQEVEREYGVDPFGFGEQVHVQLPAYWKEVKGDWDSAFRELLVNVKVDVQITMTGLAHEPLNASGGE